MENDIIFPNIVVKDGYTNLLTEKKFKMSPIKTRESVVFRKSKPLSSSQFHERKPIPSKEELVKMN